jgi:hypothetical protein
MQRNQNFESTTKRVSSQRRERGCIKRRDKALQASLKKDLDQLKKARDEVQMAVPAALVMKERQEIRQAHVFKERGL